MTEGDAVSIAMPNEANSDTVGRSPFALWYNLDGPRLGNLKVPWWSMSIWSLRCNFFN